MYIDKYRVFIDSGSVFSRTTFDRNVILYHTVHIIIFIWHFIFIFDMSLTRDLHSFFHCSKR